MAQTRPSPTLSRGFTRLGRFLAPYGVVERWNRTLKEQAVYGRVLRNLAAVRAAVAEFVERYNQCWRLEKLAYRTPLEAREEYELRHAAYRKRVSKKPGAVHSG